MPEIILNENTFEKGSSLPVFLFTLSHHSLEEDQLFCSDNAEKLGYDSYGNPIFGMLIGERKYYYVPLKITLPSQNAEQAESGSISVSNIQRVLVPFVRNAQMNDGYAHLKIELIDYDGTEDSKTNVLRTIDHIEIKNITYDSKIMSFNMSPFNLMGEPFPAARFVPSYFPALFKSL